MSLLAATVIDATVVLALGLAATVVVRKRSASLRHAILATAIVAAAAMPVFELLLPQVPIVRLQQRITSFSSGLVFTSGTITGATMADTITANDEGLPWAALFVIVWGTGALVIFSGLAAGLLRLRRLRSQCTVVEGRWRELTDELARECGVRRHVAVLRSAAPSLLVTCGVLRPAIILPAGASRWREDRVRIVLRHELAHIRRHDAAMQLVAEAVRILHWINPLAWIASRRLRQESEYACDDAVLREGVEGTEYATHLLEVARQLSGRPSSWASAHAIAHSSTLERRIVAMLQQRNRTSLKRRDWIVAALGAVAVSIPLAAAGIASPESSPLTPGPHDTHIRVEAAVPGTAIDDTGGRSPRSAVSPQAPSEITGRVLDQLGGVIPGVRMTLIDPRSATHLRQQTNAAGVFTFRDLPPGTYELIATAPGFTSISNVLTVGSGDTVRRTITLPLGTLKETIITACSMPPLARVVSAIGAGMLPVVHAQEAPAPARVGGNLKPPIKVKDVRPACPATVPAGETEVTVTARIGVDGFVNDARPVPTHSGSDVPAALIESVMDAVRQWQFTPTLLNGQPVPVEMTVSVTFRR